jgi:hypothetical protein
MRNTIKFFSLFFILILAACQDEEQCVGCNLNPKVKIRFEPINTKPYIDSLFTVVKAEIVEGEELLTEDLLAEERAIIENMLVELRKDSTYLDDQYTLFRSSNTRIDLLEAYGSSMTDFYQDTVVRDFSIPVDMQNDTSTFYFTYHGFTDTLQLFYQRDVVQTLDGVRMKLNEIGVNQEISTFDSIRVKCNKVECSNDQTTIFLYF